MANKRHTKKQVKVKSVWSSDRWRISFGRLGAGKGRPPQHIFSLAAEKLPAASLDSVYKFAKRKELPRTGLYLVHDSMGVPRYAGLGHIFSRLRSHFRRRPLELKYYSFYTVPEKAHQRELETLLIRSMSAILEFNSQKRAKHAKPGAVSAYEPGTDFFERVRTRRKARSLKRRRH